MTTLLPSFLDGSSSFMQVTRPTIKEGCGNTMPYFSDLVPFMQEKLKISIWTSTNEVNTILYFIF